MQCTKILHTASTLSGLIEEESFSDVLKVIIGFTGQVDIKHVLCVALPVIPQAEGLSVVHFSRSFNSSCFLQDVPDS